VKVSTIIPIHWEEMGRLSRLVKTGKIIVNTTKQLLAKEVLFTVNYKYFVNGIHEGIKENFNFFLA
jgi:hypothetical protein